MKSSDSEPVKSGLSPNADPASGLGAQLRPELRISAIYIFLASLWIVGSDAWLHCSLEGDLDTVFIQTFKGLNFVITTGILLYLALRRAYGGWRQAEERRMAVASAARECFRNLSSRLQSLREQERMNISREIHDELGQQLTGLKMQLRLIEDQLGDRDDRSLNPVIDGVVDATATVDEAISSVQRIASWLRPLALDHLGLAAALNEEGEQFTRRTGIECRISISDMDTPIPADVSIAAFRIFQESLTNVARHAQATAIDASCAIRDDILTLTVRDNGVGMDPETAYKPDSLGLLGMKERAANAGGFLDFKGSAGNGTTAVLTIPLKGNVRNSNTVPCEDSHC